MEDRFTFSPSLLLPSHRGTRRTRGGDRTRSRFCTAGQCFPPRGEQPSHPPGSYRAWTFRRHSGILWGLGHHRGIAQKLCHCWSGTLATPTPNFPGQRTLGARSAHTGLIHFFPHPAIALASRRPQRGHRGPPVPREMFQAFPGDYDSGSRCSSSPSAESQYLSSVDSFGSPPGAAASQVSFNGLGYCFVGFNFLSQEWNEQSPHP